MQVLLKLMMIKCLVIISFHSEYTDGFAGLKLFKPALIHKHSKSLSSLPNAAYWLMYALIYWLIILTKIFFFKALMNLLINICITKMYERITTITKSTYTVKNDWTIL